MAPGGSELRLVTPEPSKFPEPFRVSWLPITRPYQVEDPLMIIVPLGAYAIKFEPLVPPVPNEHDPFSVILLFSA